MLLLGDAACLRAKGWLAERLIERAFEAHLRDGRPHRPWRFADFHPVARLDAPRVRARRIVLSGAAGSSMAFGLGHVDGTALPGRPGACALAGHRDSWAAFLEQLRPGDELRLVTWSGTRVYRVSTTEVVSKDRAELLDDDGGSRLTLVTCYPFSGLLRSPWRYVVRCAAATGAHE